MNLASKAFSIAETLVEVLAVGLIFLYYREHSIFYNGTEVNWATIACLMKGFIATLCCLAGFFIFEKLGEGLVFGRKLPNFGYFSIGLCWVLAVGLFFLIIGFWSRYTAFLAFLPLLNFIRFPRSFFACQSFSAIKLDKWIFLLLIGTFLSAFGMCPSLAYDDHVYHLQALKEMVRYGTLWHDSFQPCVFRPLLHVVFFSWLEMIAGPTASALGNTGILLAIGMLLSSFIGRAGWLALLAWACNPEWVFLAGSNYADPLLCLVFLLGCYFLIGPAEQQDFTRDYLAGMLFGILPGIKYSGFLLIPVGMLFLLAGCSNSNECYAGRATRMCKATKAFVVAFLIASLPFLIRNMHYTGNPFNPHMGGYFDFLVAKHEIKEFSLPSGDNKLVEFSYKDFTNRFGMGKGWEMAFWTPFLVSLYSHFHSREFSLAYYDGQIGIFPIFAWMLGLIFVFRRPRMGATFLIGGLWLWLAWFSGSHQIRFLLPLVVFSCLFIGVQFQELGNRHTAFWLIIAAFSIPWTFTYALDRVNRVAPYVSGEKDLSALRSDLLPFYRAFKWANSSLSDKHRLLVLLEERTYLLEVPFFWTGLIPEQWANFLYACRSAQKAFEELSKREITHILLPVFGLETFSKLSDDPDYQATWKDFLANHLDIAYQDSHYLIFKLK